MSQKKVERYGNEVEAPKVKKYHLLHVNCMQIREILFCRKLGYSMWNSQIYASFDNFFQGGCLFFHMPFHLL